MRLVTTKKKYILSPVQLYRNVLESSSWYFYCCYHFPSANSEVRSPLSQLSTFDYPV